jgi:hypothetical protein
VRRLFACLLVAAALPAAASARTDASSVVVEGPAALAESGFVRGVLVPVARRHGITVRYVNSDGVRSLGELRAGKVQLAPVYHAAATPLLLLESGVPDLKGRLTEGTPGGNGLADVRVRVVVEQSGRKPVVLATVRTGPDGEFTASARVDASRKLRGKLVVRSDAARGQSAGNFPIGRMG